MKFFRKHVLKELSKSLGLDSDLSGKLFKLNYQKRNMRLETEDLTWKIEHKLTFHCQSR